MLDGRTFEDEVRRVARALWPTAEYSGAKIVGGRERDGIFETEDNVHIVETTTWGTKDKASIDIGKIRDLMVRHRRSDKVAIGWFITAKEPTADQRALVKPHENIRVLAFEQFQSRLIDSMGYLSLRDNYAFGSARDPRDGSLKAPDSYILPALTVEGPPLPKPSIAGLVDGVSQGARILLLGDYGTGKSMALRQVHRELARSARKGKSTRFSIHINLRDHQGQTDPVEMIERHARLLGFPHPSQLVRAWRAGQAHLLLDGFDEIAVLGWAGPTKKLRDIRRRSVQAIRTIVQETPRECGIIVAGREHFFDGRAEMLSSLDAHAFVQVRLSDFDDEQIREFFHSVGWAEAIPEWLPARPLLLAYLVTRGLLDPMRDVPAGAPPAQAWDNLLDRIAEREALIETGIDGASVRRIMERLASIARGNDSGVGPVFFTDVERAFHEIVGYPPDEGAMVLLQRLPGLASPDPQDQSRRFVDSSLVDAARAGDVIAFVGSPFTMNDLSDDRWVHSLGQLGVEVAAVRIADDKALRDNLRVAVGRLSSSGAPHVVLTSDLIRVAAEVGLSKPFDRPVFITGVWLESFVWEGLGADLSNVHFADSVIQSLELPRDDESDAELPRFERCSIGTLDGRNSPRDLPASKFVSCDVEEFVQGTLTTGMILDSSLPIGNRIVLTVLKKLYRQRGSGRRESALVRGLNPLDRRLVPAALQLLAREQLVTASKIGRQRVWLPVRGSTRRVSAILDSPTTVTDAIIAESKTWK